MPLYLSRLLPNLRAREVQRDLRDPYEMHRTLLRAFPHASAGGPGRVLWRIDLQGLTGRPVVLVQSEKSPDWSLLSLDWTAQAPECKSFEPVFQPRRRFRFRLRANPTVKRKPLGEPDGKRLGLLREEDQLAWLDRQAARHGFSVHGVTASRDEFINGSKPGHTIKFFAVRFDGLLQVVQSDLFGRALVDGIGPAKAFGCGLLSLAPAGG